MATRGTWKLTVDDEDLATYEDVLTGFNASGSRVTQWNPLLEGDEPARFDRGNFVGEWRFTLTKEHADNAASAGWFMTAAQTFNGIKTVVVYHMDYSGAESSWTLAKAEVNVTVQDPIGVVTVSEVSIKAGRAVENA